MRRPAQWAVLLILAALGAEGATQSTQPSPDGIQAILDRMLAGDPAPAPAGVGNIEWFPMSGGWKIDPGSPWQDDDRAVWMLESWQRWASTNLAMDLRVAGLLTHGPAAAGAINAALRRVSPESPAAARLVWVLGQVGDANSVPALIDLLRRTGQQKHPGIALRRMPAMAGATWALQQLSGRPLPGNPEVWQGWWETVGEDFLPARDRGRLRVSPRQVTDLVGQLDDGNAPAARERLMVLGPNAAPHLVEAWKAADESLRYRIAWVIDEIGSARSIPPNGRRDYYTRRLAEEGFSTLGGQRLRLRAIEQQSFEDFCRTAIAVGRDHKDKMSVWLKVSLGSLKQHVADLDKQAPAALPLIIETLSDPQFGARSMAARLADRIGMETKLQPPELIEALERAWLAEKDEWLRTELLCAFGRFAVPRLREAIQRELGSVRPEIVRDAISATPSAGFQGAEREEVIDRLAGLTASGEERIRKQAVRSLRRMKPAALAPELARLTSDPLPEIREETAMAIGSLADPNHAELLLRLSEDPEERVREWAFRGLGRPAFAPAAAMLALRLMDRDYPFRRQALLALGDIKGPEAVAALIREVRAGRYCGDFAFIALRKAADANLKDDAECIRWCWRARAGPPTTAPAPAEQAPLSQAQLEGCWRDLASDDPAVAYQAVWALIAEPNAAVELLGDRLRPATAEPNAVRRLIAELEADRSSARQVAQDALAALGPAAQEALEQAAARQGASEELRVRTAALLEACKAGPRKLPASRRLVHAIRVLEILATPDAQTILTTMSRGAPLAPTTALAGEALARLAARAEPVPADAGWGPAIDGIQCRLRLDQAAWPVGSTPILRIDVRNNGQIAFELVSSETFCMLEIGGTRYQHRVQVGQIVPLPPGGRHDSISLCLDENWSDMDGHALGELKPGKHTVRVSVIGVPSAPLEIEVVPPPARQPER